MWPIPVFIRNQERDKYGRIITPEEYYRVKKGTNSAGKQVRLSRNVLRTRLIDLFSITFIVIWIVPDHLTLIHNFNLRKYYIIQNMSRNMTPE